MKKPRNKLPQPGKPFAWTPRKGFSPASSLFDCGGVYRYAAKAVTSALEDGSNHDSFGAHPVVFLYRHAAECYLKGILHDFGSRVAIPQNEIRERGHDLCKQIPDVLSVATSAGGQISRRTVEAISQFNAEDPSSTAYRYDELPPNKTRIDFDVSHFCQGLDSALDELQRLYEDLRSDLIAEIERDA